MSELHHHHDIPIVQKISTQFDLDHRTFLAHALHLNMTGSAELVWLMVILTEKYNLHYSMHISQTFISHKIDGILTWYTFWCTYSNLLCSEHTHMRPWPLTQARPYQWPLSLSNIASIQWQCNARTHRMDFDFVVLLSLPYTINGIIPDFNPHYQASYTNGFFYCATLRRKSADFQSLHLIMYRPVHALCAECSALQPQKDNFFHYKENRYGVFLPLTCHILNLWIITFMIPGYGLMLKTILCSGYWHGC